MNNDLEYRVWLGWHAAGTSWDSFKRSLAETFIPATWEVMPEYGLRLYVPAVFSAVDARGLPEEVALLGFTAKADYDRSKDTVKGRSYRALHGAVFAFDRDGGHLSRSDWAGAPTDGKPSWRAAAAGGASLSDPAATVQVVLLSTPGSQAPVDEVLAVLGADGGAAAAWAQVGFTVAWVASSAPLDAVALTNALQAAVPKSEVVAVHRAVPAPVIDQKTGIPQVEQRSWHFHE